MGKYQAVVFSFLAGISGTGALGGMAHAADLPRQIVLSLFSLFLPISLLRYSWAFLMLFAGPLGVYFLIYRVVLEKDNLISRLAGLVGAFFIFLIWQLFSIFLFHLKLLLAFMVFCLGFCILLSNILKRA